jgi:hypothetical protein
MARHVPLWSRECSPARVESFDRRKEDHMLGGLSTDSIIVLGFLVAAVLFIIWLRRQ